MIKISELRDENKDRWDNFVQKHKDARFYHLFGFKEVLEGLYRDRSFYLIVENENGIIAVLPIFLVKTALFNKAVSLPFAEYAGILGGDLNDSEMKLLVNYLIDFLKERNVPYLEINGGLGLSEVLMRKFFQRLVFGQYAELELTSIKDIWENKLDGQVKKAIRKAKNFEIDFFEETSESSISNYFYPLYLKSMKRKGSPAQSLKFFIDCYCHLGEYFKIFFVRDGEKITTALQGYFTNKRVFIQHIVSEVDNFEKRPVDFIHWEFIKWACENGFKFFDFGMVRYEGQRRFKEKWGVKLSDYSYYYLLNPKMCNIIPKPITPLSPKIVFLTKIWKRAMPQIVGNFIGPFIRAQLGK